MIDYFNSPDFSGNRMICLPFPGGKGKIWHCAAAQMTAADVQAVSGQGAEGFFSYVMNIDLKKQTPTDNFPYPSMPKLGSFMKPSATVLMFDCVFNPRTEVVNSSPQFNSVNPANRWRSFAWRHNGGGEINFLDGHSQHFKTSYVTNGAGTYEVLRPDIIWNAPTARRILSRLPSPLARPLNLVGRNFVSHGTKFGQRAGRVSFSWAWS